MVNARAWTMGIGQLVQISTINMQHPINDMQIVSRAQGGPIEIGPGRVHPENLGELSLSPNYY